MIKELLRRIIKKDRNISSANRLTGSFIYRVDDHRVVSPDNRLIHADLGQAPVRELKSEKQK